MPFFNMFSSDRYGFSAFGALCVLCDFISNNRVASSLDKFLTAVWAIGVFIFMAVDVT